MKTWQGRIETPSDRRFERFTSSVDADRRLAPYDVTASRAHAKALAAAGVISNGDAGKLDRALVQIGEEIARGEMIWRHELEDVHTHLESRLREIVGDLADSLHAGRSRNDQVATDLRLYTRDRIGESLAAVLDLQSSLLSLADRYHGDVMPGYTHLQQAQPVSIAQPLLAYISMLSRDWERMAEVSSRANRSPLGSGALAGSSFPLDLDLLAAACGFAAPIPNSLDAVSDRDFLVEFVFAASLCMTHLSRLAEDLVLWSSTEFGFVHLPDAFASGSSMMPQKKNPDVAELIRGKAALTVGDVTAALTLIKGIPMGYNRDLQEDTTPLFHAADTLIPSLEILAAMLPELEFDTERCQRAVSSFTLATDLADHLVHREVPFREAHALVAKLVSDCLAHGRDLTHLTSQEYLAASPHFSDLPEMTPHASIGRKQTAGGTGLHSIKQQLNDAAAMIQDRRHESPS